MFLSCGKRAAHGTRPGTRPGTLHGTLQRDYVPFLQSGADRDHGVTGQAQLHFFLDPAFGTLHEYVGTAFLGEDRSERRHHGTTFRVENNFGASREIGNHAGIHLLQLDADGDFTHVPGAERACLGHGPDPHQRPRQFDIGIGIQVDDGLHAEAQFLGVYLVDGGIENHRPRVHNLHKRLSGSHLIAFADLAEFAVPHDALHHHDAVHRRLHTHFLDVGVGASHFDPGLVAVQPRNPDLGDLRCVQQVCLRQQLLVRCVIFLYRKLELLGIDGTAHVGGFEIENSLFPIGLGRAYRLIVRFLHRRQVGQHLLDHVFLLNGTVFVIVQALQLVLRIEFSHHLAGLHMNSGLGQLQKHQAEIATTRAAIAASIQTAAAAQNARRHERGKILRIHGPVHADGRVQVAQPDDRGGNRNQRALGSNFGVVLGFEVICRPPGAKNQYGDEDSPQSGPPPGYWYRLRRNHQWSWLRWPRRPAWSGHTTGIGLHAFLNTRAVMYTEKTTPGSERLSPLARKLTFL